MIEYQQLQNLISEKKLSMQINLSHLFRHGRTADTCDEMQCELVDAQLRAVGDYLDSFDDFLLNLPGIILGAFSTIGK